MTKIAAVARFFEQYGKHSALNWGQALQGLRYFYSHPDIDELAPRHTLRHTLLSLRLRARRRLRRNRARVPRLL